MIRQKCSAVSLPVTIVYIGDEGIDTEFVHCQSVSGALGCSLDNLKRERKGHMSEISLFLYFRRERRPRLSVKGASNRSAEKNCHAWQGCSRSRAGHAHLVNGNSYNHQPYPEMLNHNSFKESRQVLVFFQLDHR